MSSLPRFMWVSAAEVARAVDGLADGRAAVIPGVADRAGAAAGQLLPRTWLTSIIARQHPASGRTAEERCVGRRASG